MMNLQVSFLQQVSTPLARIFLLMIIFSSCVTEDWSVVLNWKAVLGLACLFGTYMVGWNSKEKRAINNENPYKGMRGQGFLTPTVEAKINAMIASSVTFDAGNVRSVKNFCRIKNKTECIFAKRAKIWGSLDIDMSHSLEENITRMVPTFYKFTLAFQDLNLDAFLIELPGDTFGKDLETFSQAVKRVLLTLREADLGRQRRHLEEHSAEMDPADVKNRRRVLGPEDPGRWNRPGWVFEFNKVTFFITTFAPFYPETNSRFAFGADNCYILLQPEISFAIHDIPPDTRDTNWDRPVTVRDKIRVAFRESGREYEPPMVTRLPMVYEIVKPVDLYDPPVKWWEES